MRPIWAIVLALALALGVGGCGGDDGNGNGEPPGEVPTGSVVVVDDQDIQAERFERFLNSRLEGISPLAPQATGTQVPLDPPEFARCIEELREQARESRRDLPRDERPPPPEDEQLQANCESLHDQARTATLASMTQSVWIEKEAADTDISVSDEEVAQAQEQYVAAAGMQEGQAAEEPEVAERRYQRLLERSGLTEEDIAWQLRTQLLQQRLIEREIEDVDDPASEQGRRQVQRAQVEFQNELQRRWRPQTLCAEGFEIPQCSNGPEPQELPVPGEEEDEEQG
jgi:hypothetical protein